MATSSYSLLKKRLQAEGGHQADRMKKEKLKTLLKALKYSEQAETIIKDNVEYRAILNKNKQKMDYDDKNISVPYDAGFKVGDVFHWVEDDSDWIIYLREGQDAYFTGICRKATYNLRWKDEYNVYHSVKATMRGPVETKIVSEMKSGLSFDKPNYTLYCIIPQNEFTEKIKRYTKVSVGERIWEVTVADAMSEPGVIELQLLESYINKIEDEELIKDVGICEFVPTEDIKIITSLDGVEQLELDEPFQLWAKVEKDGLEDKEISSKASFRVLNERGVISNGILTPFEAGNIEIILEIPRLCFTKTYVIDVKKEILPAKSVYEIVGDDKVKSFGETKYIIKHFLDGLESSKDEGVWQIEKNDKLFTIKEQNTNEIILKWSVGMFGKVKLNYLIENEIVAEKLIKVESLV